jgi:DNA-binding HxlR family transcriptional regulator
LLALAKQLSPARLSRQLRRLRDIGLIKRVTGTYRYYLTRIGRRATAALCRLTESILIPALI